MGDMELCLQVELDGHILLSVACLPPGHLLAGSVLLGWWLPSVHDAGDIMGLFLNKDKLYVFRKIYKCTLINKQVKRFPEKQS